MESTTQITAIEFENSRGQKLAGYWELPPDRPGPLPAVVFAHDAGSGKDDPLDALIAQGLVDAGIIPLRFDFTGHGSSRGKLDESTPEQQSDDLLWAIDYALRQAQCNGVIGIHGSGTGGLAALMVALTDFRFSALVLRNPKAGLVMQYAPMITTPALIIAGSDDPLLGPYKNLYGVLKVQKRLAIVSDAAADFAGEQERGKVLRETIDWFTEHLVPVEVSV
ncbi:MAG TPA: alpha/beta family hydrolase [Planctomycetota bacterium]|nr:alpha/beta family hydrolase [Planctomycetota bacterium]